MKKRVGKLILICFLLFIIVFYYNHIIILPQRSFSKTLTLVSCGYLRLKRISIRHYINNHPINEYTLDLKIELRNYQPQSYELPKFREGSAKISLEFEDGIIYNNNSILSIIIDQASDLYNKGLLIYLTTDYSSSTYIEDFVYYNQYTYFILAQEKTYYLKKMRTVKWIAVKEAPQLKSFAVVKTGYNPHRYGLWMENKWKVKQIDGDTE